MLRRCLSFSLFALLSASVFAQAPPTDDTYSSSSNKNLKNGSNILLVVQHGFDSYIKFNLATLPASPNIAKATLRVYVDAVASGGSFDVYQLNSTWSESTLNYNNAPALGISATGSHPVPITASSMNQFVLIDITSLVQSWANGSIANNGIALALTTSGGSFSFDSKESTLTSHHPELEIALSGAVGPQGPAGPAGATGAAGPAGVAGPQGVQGPAGTTGAVGAQGPIGPAGATGAQGALGPQGPIGLTGATGSQGATGAQGPQGSIGLTGPQGPQGNQGAAGANGVGFNFTGVFSSLTAYSIDDVATYNGSTYVAIVANQGGNTPDQNFADWTLMAQAGAIGPAGAAGAQGSQGPQGNPGAIGPQGPLGQTGATGAQGSQGLMGLTGPQGDQGPAGTNGTVFNFTGLFSSGTSYNINDVATYNGSTYVATVANQGGNTPDQNTADWTLMAQAGATGPAGPAGAQGTQGPQGTPGALGATGAQGPIGPTGTAGAQGAQGVPGVPGPIGPQGATGPQGPAGTSSGGVLYVVPPSATPIFDASQGSVLEITLTGNVASSTFVNAAAGQTISIILCQDSVGGHTFVPPVNVQWSTVGTATPGYCAAEQFAFDGTTAYYLGPIAYQVIAPINNLTGSGLALGMNGGTVAVPAAATMVSLPSLYSGQTYQVSVAQQPTAPVQTCTLAGNTVGIVQGMNASVPVNCIGAAGAPTNPVLTSAAQYQLTASWTPPASNGGSTLTGYTVALTNSAGPGGQAQTVSATATSATFTSVNPGCSAGIGININPFTCAGAANFTFTVTANNSFGPGTASVASNAIGSPGPPTNAVATVGIFSTGHCPQSGCVYSPITYTVPTNTGGAALTSVCAGPYQVGSFLGCGNVPYSFGYTTPFDINPLSQQVVAVNAFGAVSASASATLQEVIQ